MSKPQVIVGIDGAPAKLGLSFFYPQEHRFETFVLLTESAEGSFDQWLLRCTSMCENVLSLIKDRVKPGEWAVVLETSPPNSQMSSAMYSLDMLLVTALAPLLPSSLILASPLRIHSLYGEKTSKGNIKKRLYEITRSLGFDLGKTIGKLKSDESDASFLALWAYHLLCDRIDHLSLVNPKRWNTRLSRIDTSGVKSLNRITVLK